MDLWKYVEYKDIEPKKYLINNESVIINAKTKKLIKPINEKGYIRVSLVSISGKTKKYLLHRIAISTYKHSSELEVNHIDGIKNNNFLDNLEYVTRAENAYHAKINKLVKSCDSVYCSNFTNDQVVKICELFANGVSMNKVIDTMGFTNTKHIRAYISRILYRKTWCNISNAYEWDVNTIIYKTYDLSDLHRIADMIIFSDMKTRCIADKFPQYDQDKLKNVIKKMKQGKLYRNILDEVLRSTTIRQDSN